MIKLSTYKGWVTNILLKVVKTWTVYTSLQAAIFIVAHKMSESDSNM
jgi:hypothetical protein